MSATVLLVDDAFTRAVAEARDRLSAREGSTVSWREIVRRAGFEDDKMFGRIAYHLLPRPRDRGAHLVPTWVIDAMARVLPISRAELMLAAAEASGYEVRATNEDVTPDDVIILLTRTIEEVPSQAERDRIGSEVLAAIARMMRRDRDDPEGESNPDTPR